MYCDKFNVEKVKNVEKLGLKEIFELKSKYMQKLQRLDFTEVQ